MPLTKDEEMGFTAMYRKDVAEILAISEDRVFVRMQSIGEIAGEDTSQVVILIDGKEPSKEQAKMILVYSNALGGREMATT
jgi:hypothetical protein